MGQDAYRDEKDAATSRVEALKRELQDAKSFLRALPGGLKGQTGATYSEADYPEPPPSRWDRLCAWWRTKRQPQVDHCPDCGKDAPGYGQDCLYCGWVRPFPKDPVPPPGGSGGRKITPNPHPPNAVVFQFVGPDNVVVKKLDAYYPHSAIVEVRRERLVCDLNQNIQLGTYVHLLEEEAPPLPRPLSLDQRVRCPNCGANGDDFSEDLGWCRACNSTDPKLSRGLGDAPSVPDPLYTCPSCGETECWSPGLRWCKQCKYEEGEITEPVDLAGLSGEDLADLWTKPPDMSKAFRRGGKVGINEQHRPRQPLPLNRGGKVR